MLLEQPITKNIRNIGGEKLCSRAVRKTGAEAQDAPRTQARPNPSGHSLIAVSNILRSLSYVSYGGRSS